MPGELGPTTHTQCKYYCQDLYSGYNNHCKDLGNNDWTVHVCVVGLISLGILPSASLVYSSSVSLVSIQEGS